MPNSSLTAMYNQCRLCTNIKIIAFQDENGFVQVGNFTSAGWTLSPLYSTLEPSMGTGLALLPFYVNDLEHEVHLCYQKSNLSVSVAWWRPAVLIDARLLIPISFFNFFSAESHEQLMVGFPVNTYTTPSRMAHPLPLSHHIPTSLQATKFGSNYCSFPIKAFKSILGPESLTPGYSKAQVLQSCQIRRRRTRNSMKAWQ